MKDASIGQIESCFEHLLLKHQCSLEITEAGFEIRPSSASAYLDFW